MPESSHNEAWFVARSGESSGPYTWPQLQSAARDGELKPRDWVWCEGMQQWSRAEDQAGLLEASGPPPEPPMPPPASDDLASKATPASVGPPVLPPASPTAGEPTSSATTGAVSLGETTRQFLAAAGVSAKVRRRRQRRAVLLVLLAGVGLLLGYEYLSSDPTEDAPSPPPAKTDAVAAPTLGDADAIDRAQRCRLTGTCKTQKRVRPAAPTPEAEAAPQRRGDAMPESVPLAALTTAGGSAAALEAGPAVIPDMRREETEEGLSELQTALVKKKVTPGLKSCGGVFAATDVVVRVSTDAKGHVKTVSVPQGPLAVQRCLKRRAKYWRFGAEVASRRIELKVPAKKGLVRISAGSSER